jgi:hypothetical protein
VSLQPGFAQLWPTPVGVHRWADAPAVNPLLVRVLLALRATQRHARGEADSPFFASDDDLPRRIHCLRGHAGLTQANRPPRNPVRFSPMVIALAALSALGRMHRAAWRNHRYQFTTWRWSRVAAGLLLIGLFLKVALLAWRRCPPGSGVNA